VLSALGVRTLLGSEALGEASGAEDGAIPGSLALEGAAASAAVPSSGV